MKNLRLVSVVLAFLAAAGQPAAADGPHPGRRMHLPFDSSWRRHTGAWDLHRWSATSVGTNHNDPTLFRPVGRFACFDLRAKVRLGRWIGDSGPRPLIAANASLPPGRFGIPLGLAVLHNFDGQQLSLIRDRRYLATVNKVIRPGVWYSMRLAFDGTTLRGKLWPVACVEPRRWDVSARAVNTTGGSVVLVNTVAGERPMRADWRSISIGGSRR